MMAFKDGSREIVEIGTAALAAISLPIGLGLVMSVSSDLGAGTFRTAHTLGPSDVADGLKAFRIIDQVVDLYQWSIRAGLLLHGLSSQVRDAHDIYAKTNEKSRTISSIDGFSQATRNPS
jgi:hypothetical protein